ncbi:hypothetical protein H5410_045442 [Solanum commersonii]|uniref:Uncharacterized protein n=1 Tax=Solanum commersonii TaxID=4109 RepID=A0A9J5XDP1_SOLCO|nr:hypothetical protein H5410_045442 [Solanum commersonii]
MKRRLCCSYRENERETVSLEGKVCGLISYGTNTVKKHIPSPVQWKGGSQMCKFMLENREKIE